ncbi:AcaB family transcriptional regulator [Legionella genomosp. 1]|uniref:AcaB family transcriptional regulator n=1 Tax=Legionella genomosp. 1 TaxID=1093625 RepID=UPI0010553454|nr:AcaB family transcriptional regulator [Legionella genomosp. 1]
MKAEITLNLRTREVYKLFERKISGDRLFIEAILHKINIVIGRCRRQDPIAIKVLYEMEQQLNARTQEFASEIKRFEVLLSKKKEFKDKQINFVVQFHPKLIVYNSLILKLAEFFEVYDNLIANLKLLRLIGCFDTDEAYFINTQKYQKSANQTLSKIVLFN